MDLATLESRGLGGGAGWGAGDGRLDPSTEGAGAVPARPPLNPRRQPQDGTVVGLAWTPGTLGCGAECQPHPSRAEWGRGGHLGNNTDRCPHGLSGEGDIETNLSHLRHSEIIMSAVLTHVEKLLL